MADYLAQQPLQDYRPMHLEFPDEDIMALFEEKRTHEAMRAPNDRDERVLVFEEPGTSNKYYGRREE